MGQPSDSERETSVAAILRLAPELASLSQMTGADLARKHLMMFGDRSETNALFVQPFVSKMTKTLTTFRADSPAGGPSGHGYRSPPRFYSRSENRPLLKKARGATQWRPHAAGTSSPPRSSAWWRQPPLQRRPRRCDPGGLVDFRPRRQSGHAERPGCPRAIPSKTPAPRAGSAPLSGQNG